MFLLCIRWVHFSSDWERFLHWWTANSNVYHDWECCTLWIRSPSFGIWSQKIFILMHMERAQVTSFYQKDWKYPSIRWLSRIRLGSLVLLECRRQFSLITKSGNQWLWIHMFGDSMLSFFIIFGTTQGSLFRSKRWSQQKGQTRSKTIMLLRRRGS